MTRGSERRNRTPEDRPVNVGLICRSGPGSPAVAPEVAERIVARRATGEPVSSIAGALHLTLAEVRRVIGDAEQIERVEVAP